MLHVAIAERFRAGPAFAALLLPHTAVAAYAPGVCTVWLADGAGRDWRRGDLRLSAPPDRPLHLAFPAFDRAEPCEYFLFVSAAGADAPGLPGELRALMDLGRPPIELNSDLPAPDLPPRPPRGIHLVEDGRAVPGNAVPPGRIVTDIGTYWRDALGAHLSGWAHCGALPIRRLALLLDGAETELALHPRPDVLAHYPECGDAVPVGWKGYVPGPADRPLELRADTPAGPVRAAVAIPPRLTRPPPPAPAVHPIQERFMAMVNRDRLRVLELGARRVSPDAIDWRPAMAEAAGYVGFDVEASPHVDVVGDAHALTRHVPAGSFGAVWSAAVVEHLAAPWLAAAEINRALRPGGITFHLVPQAWPVHEAPADYWRASDEALRVLFGPAFGFEVLEAGMDRPLHLYPLSREGPYAELPLFPGYGWALVLSRKVAELPPPSALEARQRELAGMAAAYPDSGRAFRP